MIVHIKHIIYRPHSRHLLMVLICFLVLLPAAYPVDLLTIELHRLQQLLSLRQLVYLLQALVQLPQLPHHHYSLIMHCLNLRHLPLLVLLVFPHLLLLDPRREHQRHQRPLFGLLLVLLQDLLIHHWVLLLLLAWQ